ncbi:membrane protein [Helicobacter pylori PZ5026]|nr:membrane protein [Helicobacter pylori PZ5026]
MNRIIFILGTPYLIRNASLSLSIFIAFFKFFIIIKNTIKNPLGWLFLSHY